MFWDIHLILNNEGHGDSMLAPEQNLRAMSPIFLFQVCIHDTLEINHFQAETTISEPRGQEAQGTETA